jgi:transcriptional regulator with XRE-family HTH domain
LYVKYLEMDISEKIKALRESKKIKQRDIAASLNIDQSNYSRFEQRGDKLTIEQLQSICSVLGISLAEFFNNSGGDITIKESKDDLLKLLDEKGKLIEALQKSLIAATYNSFASFDEITRILFECRNILSYDNLTPLRIERITKLVNQAEELSNNKGMADLREHIELRGELEAKAKSKKAKKTTN